MVREPCPQPGSFSPFSPGSEHRSSRANLTPKPQRLTSLLNCYWGKGGYSSSYTRNFILKMYFSLSIFISKLHSETTAKVTRPPHPRFSLGLIYCSFKPMTLQARLRGKHQPVVMVTAVVTIFTGTQARSGNLQTFQ